MATSYREKIVRIEDSFKADDSDEIKNALIPHESNSNNSRGNTVSVVSPDDKALAVVAADDLHRSTGLSEDEEDDKLPALPEGWPKIPQIFERRSWDFCTTVSPSVNKAASHLELLQGIIEEWFKESESEVAASRAASTAKDTPTQSRPTTLDSKISALHQQKRSASSGRRSMMTPRDRKQLRFLGTPTTVYSNAVKSVESDTSELCVQGFGTVADQATEQVALEYQLPFLGADEVIDETITLMARMENDRQETLENYKKEKQRTKTLAAKIDELCINKLLNLPAAVQQEHVACADDIVELHWHVNSQTREEERDKKWREEAKKLNEKLKQDIAFIKGHIPLVREKLELEKEAMERINQAQKDTDDELNLVNARCAKVKAKSDEAHVKAEQERAAIKKDLDNVREDLSRITEELSSAKMLYNTYIHQVNEYTTHIQESEQEVQILRVKKENVKAAEKLQDAKVKELQKKVRDAEYEQKYLEAENDELQADKDYKHKKNQEILAELTETIENQKERKKLLVRKNKELDMDIEDLEFKLKDCDKQKNADEKNLERMIKELQRTEEQYAQIIKDLAEAQLLNEASRAKLQEEEDKTFSAEEQLRATADALKRQVKEEIQSKAIISAKMAAEEGDTNNFAEETNIKKERATKIVDEVENAVKAVQKKVDKLRNAKKERNMKISDLQQKIQKLEMDTQEVIDKAETEMRRLLPGHTAVSEKVGVLRNELDTMNKRTEMMNKRIEEMTSAGGMMVKSITTTTKAIDRLTIEQEELTTQIKTNQALDDELQSQLDVTKARMASQTKHHRALIEARENVFKQHQDFLNQQIAYNAVLASRYRKLMNDYITLRNKLLDKYDATINAEHTIKDTKQLQGLQKKMHSAMNVYLKYRGMYNRGELRRITGESNKSCHKVALLQESMNLALDQIADFLQNQLNPDTVRALAMDKVIRQEMAEEEAQKEREKLQDIENSQQQQENDTSPAPGCSNNNNTNQQTVAPVGS